MTTNRSIKPEPGSDIEFALPGSENFNLDNGLKVVYIHKEKLPMIRAFLMIEAGSKFDNDKSGLAHLTSLILDEGADGLTALEISDKFDMLGANFNISTDNDTVNISLQTVTENFEPALQLFSKIILKPDFLQTDFEREKKKLLTRILQSKDEPEYIADQIFDRIIFGDKCNYSFPFAGYEDTVNNISVDDVKQHYKRFFSPQNSALIVVGDIAKSELIKILQSSFGSWEKSNPDLSYPADTPMPEKRIFIHHKKDTVQTEIRTGHLSVKRDEKNYYARLILNTILGGQFSSRINLNLREKNGYTYGATSRFNYYKDAAFFEVSTSVGIENTYNALKEIFYELENMQNGVTEEELNFAKSSVVNKFPLNFETYRQISSNAANKIIFGLPDDYFETYIQKINAITKADVDKAAKEFIYPHKSTTVLVGDKDKILKQLPPDIAEIIEVDLFGNKIM